MIQTMRNSEHPLGGSSARETDLLFLTGINDSMEATENGSKSISELRPTATTSDFGYQPKINIYLFKLSQKLT
jgi:hypothetical protein